MLSNTNNILTGEHMFSKYITELSEKEKNVILQLAEKGPMCGYDFHLGGQRKRGLRKALMSSGYWHRVLKHIGPAGNLKLIALLNVNKKIKKADGRGRRKDLYYLTPEGVSVALELDINLLKSIMLWDRKIFGDTSARVFILELVEILGIDLAFRVLSKRTNLLFSNDYVEITERVPLSPEKLKKLEDLLDSLDKKQH